MRNISQIVERLLCKGEVSYRRRWRSFSVEVTPRRILLSIIVAAVVWAEWLALEVKRFGWSSADVSSSTVRVLIVADPQLLGYRDEPRLLGAVTRWDADRYTRRAFAHAKAHVKPHLIIFMGDLFDEGEKDNAVEFNATLDRFRNTFPVDGSQVIYISGDNDVGGEWGSVKASRVARFNEHFKSKFDLRALGLETMGIIHTNLFNAQNEYLTDESAPSALRVVLSHAPLLRGYGRERRVIQMLSPSLILSAHDHIAEYCVRARDSVTFERHAMTPASLPVDFVVSQSGPMVELQAPTCSYRMGVKNMGFGVVFIEPRDDAHRLLVRYQVLWLPGRYPQLWFIKSEQRVCGHRNDCFISPFYRALAASHVLPSCSLLSLRAPLIG
uniref:Calcineurin-like phosphoesterase domain-containing protein n=1 Tax=Plectus sambesii TaxID=2011161 RepID=A0A914WBN0_9BILA